MIVHVNGQPQTLPDGATVAALLVEQKLNSQPCAVEVNKSLVPKRQHTQHILREGDAVEIVTLVGGG